MIRRDDDEQAATSLSAQIAKFERDNPELVAELEVLGTQVDDYLRLSAEYEPKVITSSSSSMP